MRENYKDSFLNSLLVGKGFIVKMYLLKSEFCIKHLAKSFQARNLRNFVRFEVNGTQHKRSESRWNVLVGRGSVSGSRVNSPFLGTSTLNAVVAGGAAMLLCQHEVKTPPVQATVIFQDLKIKLVIKTCTCQPPSCGYMAIKVLAASKGGADDGHLVSSPHGLALPVAYRAQNRPFDICAV